MHINTYVVMIRHTIHIYMITQGETEEKYIIQNAQSSVTRAGSFNSLMFMSSFGS